MYSAVLFCEENTVDDRELPPFVPSVQKSPAYFLLQQFHHILAYHLNIGLCPRYTPSFGHGGRGSTDAVSSFGEPESSLCAGLSNRVSSCEMDLFRVSGTTAKFLSLQ